MFTWIKRHELLSYFILAYAITWLIWAPILAASLGWIDREVPYSLYYLGPFGPMTAALVVTALTKGRVGIRDILSRIVKWRVSFRYYAFAVLVPVALFILAVLLNRVITGLWPDLSLLGQPDYLPYIGPFATLGLWLLTYGLGEETGWRGFALPHLQEKHSAANSSLILALLWGGWHLPAFFFRDTYIGLGLLGFPMFLIMMIFSTMIFTWLYNSTHGSIFLVILFHAVFNWLSVSEAGGQFATTIMSAPLILWALFITRRYGTENAAPVHKQVA